MKRVAAFVTGLSFLLLPITPAFAQLGTVVPPAPPADTTPPVISGIVQSSLLPTGITLAWTTNKLATSVVRYGLTTSYGSTVSASITASLAHTAILTGLTPATTYYYCINTTDTSNNTSSSCSSFATSPAPDVTAPLVSVVAAIATTTSATITWTTNEAADSQVEYGTTSGYGMVTNADTTLALTHTVELTDLAPGTTYHYRVLSKDASANVTTGDDLTFSTGALPSVSADVTVTDTTPPVITDISSVSLEPHTATILWATNELATSTLEYGTTSNYGSTTTLPVTALLAHSATLLGLAANTTYYFCIHATDVFGNSSSSCPSSNTFTTAAAQTTIDTMPPTITLVTASSITTTSANFNWTTSEVASGYVEYGATDAYGSQTTLDTNLSPTHAASIVGLAPNTLYHYRVHSSDEAGNASVTADETFTTGAPTVVQVQMPVDRTPPSITNILAASVGSTQAFIEWTTDRLATTRLVYGTTINYGSTATLPSSALLSHNATLLGLTPGTTYYYCVYATDVAGNTANSCGHSFTTIAVPGSGPDTTAPTVLVIIANSVATSSATVAWSTSEAGTSQVAYGLTSTYGSFTTVNSTLSPTHSVGLTGLMPGTTYHYQVRSIDAAGNSGVSTDNTFTTDALPPVSTTSNPSVSAPTPNNEVGAILSNVEVQSVGQTSETITWSSDLPANSVVQYGDDMEFDEVASSSALVTSHSVALSGLTPNTVYDFRVLSMPASAGAMETVSSVYDSTTLPIPVVIDPPATILSVSNSSVTSSGVSISFATDEMTTGQIEYGTDTSYGLAVPWSQWQNSGTIVLAGLVPSTAYHYRVRVVDAADNLTYSEDHTFTTAASILGSVAQVATTTPVAASTTVSVTTASSSPSSPVSGGSANGGSVSISDAVPTPALVTAAPVDSQIVFIWNNPLGANVADTEIVRGTNGYPTSPSDGQVIYSGAGTTFTDTNLANGTNYYYALYSQGIHGGHSSPLTVSAAPAAGVTQVQLDENPVPQPALPSEHFSADLAVGAHNLEVEHLQQILNTVNVHPSGLTTGYFGSLTKAALKTFQAKYSLAQTGVADTRTRAVLSSISQGWMLPAAPTTIASLTTDLKSGDRGEMVANLQKFLAYEGSYPEALVTGRYGSLTRAAVQRFQKKFGVTPVSGYVGLKTRHTIQTVLGR